MMSGHGANPIPFIKIIKIGRPEHLLTPHPPSSDNTSTMYITHNIIIVFGVMTVFLGQPAEGGA